MKKEYKVVMYDTILKDEEYEWFTNKKESIKYAKDMVNDRTITSVWLIEYDYENNEENIECIWESEE